MNLKEKIQKIKKENPELGYQSIANKISCGKNTVRYHLDPSQKEAVRNRVRKLRKTQHPLYRKLIGFCTNYGDNRRKSRNNSRVPVIPLETALKIIGNEPVCYLTGEKIDILELNSFSLDHKIPLSKGGKSTIENCGITTKRANTAKNGMSPEEFFDFCKRVLEHQGYKVTK